MNKQENKKNAKKLSGFYIALCCCVLVIGIAGYFTEKHTENTDIPVSFDTASPSAAPVFSNDAPSFTGEVLSSEDTSNNEIPVISQSVPEAEEDVPEENVGESADVDFTIDNPDMLDGAVTVMSDQPVFEMPAEGEIVGEFTDALEFNTALGDWRTHNGIDIAVEKGCAVQTAAQGVADAIYENETGYCVEISHAGDFVTKYMGLASVDGVSEGKEVQYGEMIGTAGDCAGENVKEPHLHFEMYKKGEAVNPTDYLTIQ